MSKQLVKIHQKHFANGELIQTINARDLHAFLEVGKDFSKKSAKIFQRGLRFRLTVPV